MIKFKKAVTEPMLVVTLLGAARTARTPSTPMTPMATRAICWVNTIGSHNGTNLINIHNDENWPLARPSAHTIADEVGAGAALQCERAY
jgi:hypothetical protein